MHVWIFLLDSLKESGPWLLTGILLFLCFGVGLYFYRLARKTTEAFPYTYPGLPAGKWVQLKEGKIHYIDVGQGPVLLLVHGIGASVYCWRRLIPLLQKHFRVVALDLLGFGLSDKNVLAQYDLDHQSQRLLEFMDALKIEKFHLLGSSMGGLLALWLGRVASERIQKIVALSPAVSPKLFPLNPKLFLWISPWSAHKMDQRWMHRILRRVIEDHTLIDEESLDAYLYPYRSQPSAVKTFIQALSTIKDPRIPSLLSTVRSPVLLLHGEKDKIIPLKVSESAMRSLTHGQLKVFKTAGHHLQEDQPEWVAQQVQEFLLSSS